MRSANFAEEQNKNNFAVDVPERARISELNDRLRIHGSGGRILFTAGVQSLSDERRQQLFDAIKSYSAFTPDNDPYGEHDFGEVEIDTTSIMFKIDYYDLSESFSSPNPADPAVTTRIMTIMLSDEY
ncbi:DUF3768 domain-containing protein [Rhizobium sp. G21]|uniref:DUF3768 domain-containing protein n=1 Tax=Rhizobium sp. G21 TaxID=2758439 RepID=UPI0015FFA431|nr:DUF3768 domain-containing protein [Rhizobium sp. G21]MBB1249149.1 DUF3768 domain-containing protein [Rhizobium sp. G21]